MAINLKKVFIGGVAAGAVLIVINILAMFGLGSRVEEEMNASIQASARPTAISGFAIAAGIVLKLVIGIVLTWFYAAIRPRFGPGFRTASYVALIVWLLGAIFFSDYLMMGIMSLLTYILVEVIQLLSFLVAIWVGARIYSEESTPGT